SPDLTRTRSRRALRRARGVVGVCPGAGRPVPVVAPRVGRPPPRSRHPIPPVARRPRLRGETRAAARAEGLTGPLVLRPPAEAGEGWRVSERWVAWRA